LSIIGGYDFRNESFTSWSGGRRAIPFPLFPESGRTFTSLVLGQQSLSIAYHPTLYSVQARWPYWRPCHFLAAEIPDEQALRVLERNLHRKRIFKNETDRIL